ncbi:hypothetical protein L596_020251 [Steinernema carpocapsae]|uniref:Uncharacterized protein n=1 Tax=Steinernema carpocapsae TaxID=34508 RepID=A0A4U5MSZ8_STECR|nr:hypothetical protein L596_020251 [Steinernema carpocapsae]
MEHKSPSRAPENGMKSNTILNISVEFRGSKSKFDGVGKSKTNRSRMAEEPKWGAGNPDAPEQSGIALKSGARSGRSKNVGNEAAINKLSYFVQVFSVIQSEKARIQQDRSSLDQEIISMQLGILLPPPGFFIPRRATSKGSGKPEKDRPLLQRAECSRHLSFFDQDFEPVKRRFKVEMTWECEPNVRPVEKRNTALMAAAISTYSKLTGSLLWIPFPPPAFFIPRQARHQRDAESRRTKRAERGRNGIGERKNDRSRMAEWLEMKGKEPPEQTATAPAFMAMRSGARSGRSDVADCANSEKQRLADMQEREQSRTYPNGRAPRNERPSSDKQRDENRVLSSSNLLGAVPLFATFLDHVNGL